MFINIIKELFKMNVYFLLLLFVVIIGLIKIIILRNKLKNELTFINDFLNKFKNFTDNLLNETYEEEKYEWLRLNSSKMQDLMGAYGTMRYQPPGSNVVYNNYTIILNGIGLIKQLYNNYMYYRLTKHHLSGVISDVYDSLLLFKGSKRDQYKNNNVKMKNPIIWLVEGIKFFLLIPFYFLNWSNVITDKSINKISSNIIFQIINVVISFGASVLTILKVFNIL